MAAAALATLAQMLHHPIYAGAYAYGRRRVDPKRNGRGGRQGRMRSAPMARVEGAPAGPLPAYITWERYLANQQRLRAEPLGPGSPGRPAAAGRC